MNNFRFALRQVVKRPALSIVVVLMLGVTAFATQAGILAPAAELLRGAARFALNQPRQSLGAALAAAGSVSLWVGEPAPANQQAAQAALAAAQEALTLLTSSPWLAQETTHE